MPIAISIDGVPAAGDAARVSVLDRGFLFGDSVFEVLRTYGGVPFAAREHLERLERSCRGLGFAMPASVETIEREVREVIARSGEPDCYVRVVVTRGLHDVLPISISPPASVSPLRVVIAAPLPHVDAAIHAQGVELGTVLAHRPTDRTTAEGAKISAYVMNMLALAQARARGAYEALLVDEEGAMSEGSSSNFFVVQGGAVVTPPPSTGLLVGITRTFALEACASLGVPVRERVLFTPDVRLADEAFLSSSIREIVPVVRLDGWTIGDGRPGALTRRIHARFGELVAAHCAARARADG